MDVIWVFKIYFKCSGGFTSGFCFCTQILTNVAMTQYGEDEHVCGVWWDVSLNLPLIPRWDF